MMDTDTLTRERAYLLWEQAGRPDGRSEEFWFAAAASLAGDAQAAAKPAPRRRTAAAPAAAKPAQPAKRGKAAASLGKAPAAPPAMVRS